MHRVVPELIIDKYRRGEFSGEFEAVSLFLDLSGFSRMTDMLMQHGQLGAEVLANLMHGVFDPLVENIFHHGGKIVSFAGDGIMALFPVEQDSQTIALHALSAAWTMQRRLLEHPERQTIFGAFQFSVKIGLSIGPVSWGILRSVGGAIATYYFRGPAVDAAARAEHAAQAGQIILTEEIWSLFEDEIQTSPHASYYQLCGFQIERPDPVPIVLLPVDLEVARLFMPEEIITEDLHGEFRQIVNLFVRFPDLSFEELQELTQVIFELNDQYGGLINRLDFGDKGCNMLMLWGAPITYENDIGRALNFILDLKARVDFVITAGVTYYIAHAGYLGSTMCEDYTCYGWGVNLASRFMMSAPDGSVWTDARIARRVKNRFDFEYRGSLRFKGFAEEEKVYGLSGRKSQELYFQGEFVGREVEVPHLIDSLQPLWNGEFAGVTVIWGEAGAGKSRLVYELRTSLLYGGKKFLWAPCNADQILRHSFNPFRYWLFHYFEVDPTMDITLQAQAFDRKLDELIGKTTDSELARELDRLRTVLGSLVGLKWNESFYEQLDAEGRYNNTLNALIALVKAESLCQPVILAVEDAHFIDEDSKVFLARLKRALQAGNVKYPVAILVGSRPTGANVKQFLTESLVDRSMDLSGLSVQALSRLAEIYLGGAASPELIALLKARSEGNPYFAEQILIYLKEENLLEISNTGWSLKRYMQETALPTDIRALLVSRLDQLPRRVRDVIQTAAVLGREFSQLHLAAMVPENSSLLHEMGEAEQAHVWLAIGPSQYFFTHALLRDAAYAMQTHANRVKLHALAVHAMETVYGGEIHQHYGELAHHAERAAMAEKALYYLRHAAKAAADSYLNSEAVNYYTRALVFVPPDDLAIQFDLLAERVELYARMGKRDLQWKDLNALERWAEQLNDPLSWARVMFQRATYHHTLGQYLDAVEYAKRADAYAIAETAPELGIKIQYTWSSALLRLGKPDEAMRQAQIGLQLARRFQRRADEARTLTVMGLIALEQKEPRRAYQYLEASLLMARELNERRLESYALNNLALSEGSVEGNYVLAAKHYEEAYRIAREIGDRYQEGLTLTNLGFAAGMKGNFPAAYLCYEDALQVAREIGNLNQETYTLINMSAVAGLRKEAAQALRFAQEADELSKKIHDRSAEAWSQLYKGYALLLMEECAEARKSFQESIAIRMELGQVHLAMEPRAGLVEAALCTDDLPAASLEAEKILSFLADGGSLDGTEEPLRIYHNCYQYLKQQKDPRAQQVLGAAAQLLEMQVSKFADDTARKAFVENFPWRQALRKEAQA